MLLITCGVCVLRCKLRADVLSPGAPRRFGAELKTLVMHLKKRYCLHNNVIIHIFIKVQNRSVSMGFNYAYQVVLPGQPGFLSMLPGGGGGERQGNSPGKHSSPIRISCCYCPVQWQLWSHLLHLEMPFSLTHPSAGDAATSWLFCSLFIHPLC